MVVINNTLITLLVIVALWDLAWKIVGSWRAARNNQFAWFILILLLNTVGILPLVYLIWFEKNKNVRTSKRR